VDGELRRTDQMVLSAAEARVHTLVREQGDDEGPSVSSELNHGPVVADLARLSRHASRLVLEHRHERSGAEVIPVSTTAGLAVVAHCPVVVVHPRWRPSTTGTVVVGIDDLSRASSVLEVADREAVARGARLRVVTVTSDPGTAPDVDSLPDTASDAEHVVRTGNVADALLAEARDSELLVVGRHHRNHLLGVPLGRTVHHLLGHSPVPLLIVDPAARGGRS
jgi:nucleotide-binding universal stress UspA family protein